MKNVLLPLLAILLLAGCEKEAAAPEAAASGQAAEFRAGKGKIDVCHYSEEEDSWHLINISVNAWPAHAAHGDVRLDDQDDDGFVPDNECGFGNMGDCDDRDDTVNPDATEDCGNGIDDDCDGQVDNDDIEDCAGILEILIDPDGNPETGDEYTLYVHPEDQRAAFGTTINNGVFWGSALEDLSLNNYSTSSAALTDFDGPGNTATIVTESGFSDYAAEVCAELEYGGYTDWYLPALGELNAMYEQLGPRGNNNFTSRSYWSSTEGVVFSLSEAWAVIFIDGQLVSQVKDDTPSGCRCVRR